MVVVTYDREFYELEGKVARQSAEVVLPWLFETYPEIRTVVDVGCGTGEWAAQAVRHGAYSYGIDRDVPADLAATYIANLDLASEADFGACDLAICLEVAEHLPAEAAERLVKGLAASTLILFSAATPGQPGVGHINCQPHEYWHGLFAEHGFEWTHIGPTFGEPVADFYCRNMFLYERPVDE